MELTRVSASEAAKEVIGQLREKHGDLMFHMSGGCCDGSAPMCFEKGDFILGSRDLHLGDVHGCGFYMAHDQYKYYENMHVMIDVAKGRGASFSLEIPLGLRFMAKSRVLTEEELAEMPDPLPAT